MPNFNLYLAVIVTIKAFIQAPINEIIFRDGLIVIIPQVVYNQISHVLVFFKGHWFWVLEFGVEGATVTFWFFACISFVTFLAFPVVFVVITQKIAVRKCWSILSTSTIGQFASSWIWLYWKVWIFKLLEAYHHWAGVNKSFYSPFWALE